MPVGYTGQEGGKGGDRGRRRKTGRQRVTYREGEGGGGEGRGVEREERLLFRDDGVGS